MDQSPSLEPRTDPTQEFEEGVTATGHDLEVEPYFETTFRKLVILIHGSNSLGDWQGELKAALDNDGFNIRVESVKYTTGLVGAVWNPQQEDVFEDMRGQIAKFTELDPNQPTSSEIALNEISFIAHSYGTYLLISWLNGLNMGEVRHVILLASIAKSNDIVSALRRTHFVVNDVAVSDTTPCWAQALKPEYYQATGVYGVRRDDPKIADRFFDGRHSKHVELTHLQKKIIPIIRTGAIPETQHNGPKRGPGLMDRIKYLYVPMILIAGIAAICGVVWGIAWLIG